MRTTRVRYLSCLRAAVLAVFLSVSLALVSCQQPAGETVRVDSDDLGGVVSSTKGPEAGVWVIAETTDLPTKFVKIAVTDDGGRYVLPDLPDAIYSVWVRGYGLVDSAKVETAPGKIVNLTAVAAPNAAAAAEYYPAGYWFSLLRAPDKSQFPGTGPSGNGISPNMKSQAQWLRNVKSGNCWACHQLGTKATREIPESLGSFPSSVAAWERRILSGQAGGSMANGMARLGARRAFEAFADWTDRGRRRRAAARAAAAPGPGAQRRHHPVGLGRSQGLPPRSGLHGPAGSDGERQRPYLRGARGERGLPARSGSREPHAEPGQVDGA